MLRIVLWVAALSLVADADVVTYTEDTSDIDISACPFTVYGETATKFTALISQHKLYFQTYSMSFSKSEAPYQIEVVTDADSLPAATKTVLDAAPTCGVRLELMITGGSKPSNVYLLGYGTEAGAIYIDGDTTSGQYEYAGLNLGGSSVETYTYPGGAFTMSWDVTGCTRHMAFYKAGAEVPRETKAEECVRVVCPSTGGDVDTEQCGRDQDCLGEHNCVEKLVSRSCSAVGPFVVDDGETATAVSDFCARTLSAVSGLTVVGHFLSRRRLDTPFLSRVTLSHGEEEAVLEGGAVYVKDVMVELSETATTAAGIAFSKTAEGVRAVYTGGAEGYEASLFYDGTVLDLKQSVPRLVTETAGLCFDSTVENKADSSPDGCDVVPEDTDAEITCDDVKAECSSKLSGVSDGADDAPFTAAFQTVCEEMFCKYPEQDGLLCHVLDAFARRTEKEDWRDAAACAVSVCAAHPCASQEFCGLSDGHASCLCQAVSVKTFKENDAYGKAPTCSKNSVSLTVVDCLVREKGFDPEGLHLMDPSCKGSNEAGETTFTYSSSQLCAGEYTMLKDGQTISFSNEVRNVQSGTVAFEDSFALDFSCTYAQPPEPMTASFRIADGSVSVTYESGAFSFSLTFGLFSDSDLSAAVESDTELALNQLVWASVKADGVEGDALALVLDRCWATPEAESDGEKKHDLISGGCASGSDGKVKLLSNAVGLESTFRFNVFSFVDVEGVDLYLHCQASLCVKADGCEKTCE